jgi:ferredoxin
MKISVDRERCQGHGRCALLVPEIFDLDEEGFSVVIREDVPEAAAADAKEAVANCPERAILLSG